MQSFQVRSKKKPRDQFRTVHDVVRQRPVGYRVGLLATGWACWLPGHFPWTTWKLLALSRNLFLTQFFFCLDHFKQKNIEALQRIYLF